MVTATVLLHHRGVGEDDSIVIVPELSCHCCHVVMRVGVVVVVSL